MATLNLSDGMTPASAATLRGAVAHGVMLAFTLAVATALVVRLSDVLMMAFGSILVAVVLHAFADPVAKWTGAGRKTALTLVVVVLLFTVAGAVWVFGRAAAEQFAALSDRIPRIWSGLNQRLADNRYGAGLLQQLVDQVQDSRWVVAWGQRVAGQVAASVAAGVIVAFAGLYLAYNPNSYAGGLLLLLPRQARARAQDVLAEIYEALRRWLLAQFGSMLLVGVTTGIGLQLVGAPSALALGLIAGLGQFVPVVGPMAATVPGLLVSAGVGLDTFLWTAAVYVAASQFEANFITPLVLRQMAQLPMALTLFAVLAMGVLFGPLGVLYATPLAVVSYVVVRRLYVAPLNGDADFSAQAGNPPAATQNRR